jgi:hypothetical protein
MNNLDTGLSPGSVTVYLLSPAGGSQEGGNVDDPSVFNEIASALNDIAET